MTKSSFQTPWIHSPLVDGVLILAPSFIVVVMSVVFQDYFMGFDKMPTWSWVVLVLSIDVAHVYSTLYRTYFDRTKRHQLKEHLKWIPFFVLMGSLLLYSQSAIWFWRVLAYLAVFHFVRQQYGFMMIYRRQINDPVWSKNFDKVAIYLVTILPIIYWHFSQPRDFNWFVENDFIKLSPLITFWPITILSLGLVVVFSLKEYLLARRFGWNIGKIAVLYGTALSWYFGIVLFNNDFIFTLTNVVAHGVPYIALIWIKEHEKLAVQGAQLQGYKQIFRLRYVPIFLASLFLFAFIEEGLWAGLVWREHFSFLGIFQSLPKMNDSLALALIVPILSLPQATHYVLDGFLWRSRDQI